MPDLRNSYPAVRVKNLADETQFVELAADGKGRLVNLSNAHYKIHQGDYYSVGHYNASVANGGVIRIIVDVPAGLEAHTSINPKAGGDLTLQVYDGVTYTGGTPITPQNHDRCSPNDSTVVAVHTPATVPASSLIWQEYFPGGTGGLTPGAVGTVGEQVVLCPSETYMFEITNISGVANPLNIVVSYYEVVV